MKIYTKTGDKGQTSLLSGKRVSKHNSRIDAYGSIDELNSLLSLIISESKNKPNPTITTYINTLKSVQHSLFNIGSFLACDDNKILQSLPPLQDGLTIKLEQQMDTMNSELPPLKNFIIPGGTLLASHIHVARSFCRRTERRCCLLAETEPINDKIVPFLNRLSDYLFCLARFANFSNNINDIHWEQNQH